MTGAGEVVVDKHVDVSCWISEGVHEAYWTSRRVHEVLAKSW